MARVVALYRYPLKGFAPEECDTLTVLGEGRIAGDALPLEYRSRGTNRMGRAELGRSEDLRGRR